MGEKRERRIEDGDKRKIERGRRREREHWNMKGLEKKRLRMTEQHIG